MTNMAELTAKDRLLPSLLDRLTDDEPSKQMEVREQKATSMSYFREAVKRDLEWLMNTVNLESVINFDDFPELRGTVINYGIPGLAGGTTNAEEFLVIKQMIIDAITNFEPRIFQDTLNVQIVEDLDRSGGNIIAYEIQGTIWGKPLPEALFLRTELDLELGEVKVREI